MHEHADRRGFTIYKEYVDHVSGDAERRRVKHENDCPYRELMEEAGRRKFDCVLVWKYDRFARSLSNLVAALQQFSALGIDFISYTQNIDTTTAMGRLFYHVIGSFAEFEREMIVERVKALHWPGGVGVFQAVSDRTHQSIWPLRSQAGPNAGVTGTDPDLAHAAAIRRPVARKD